jgi:hypothetical protein
MALTAKADWHSVQPIATAMASAEARMLENYPAT